MLDIKLIRERPDEVRAALLKRGFTETQIRKVMGENWLRVLKDVWGA